MLSLDNEDGLVAERPVGALSAPPRRSIGLRPVAMGLVVLALGGGLGAGAYLLSALDTRDVIALLDVGDQPRLSLEMPVTAPRKLEPLPALPAPGSLLTPPGAAPGVPAVTPPPSAAPAPPAVAAPPAPPPLAKPEPPPPVVAAPATAPAPAAPAPATPQAIPQQPQPRSADQAPTYASLPARMAEIKPLAPAPLEALVRQSPNGLLPVVAKDGRQAWKTYARPFDAPAGKPRVAVVVTGLGLDKDATEAAIAKLPPEITLAFSAYAGGLDKWIKKARDAGHEVMLTLPAETIGYPARDPGPLGLLVGNPAQENNQRLERLLARSAGAVGVLAPEGAFTQSAKLAPVLAVLKDRGLLYVGGGARPEAGLPLAAVTDTLDVDVFRDALEARLARVAAAAKESGQGLVVVTPRPLAFDRLVVWLDNLGEQGIALAPASGVVKQTGKP